MASRTQSFNSLRKQKHKAAESLDYFSSSKEKRKGLYNRAYSKWFIQTTKVNKELSAIKKEVAALKSLIHD
jgi:hypothetical protein